ncbi:MAG: AAA family ATPase [Candidatus Sericytochromatia bacterium]|nr:AAA family ATPase [Candidatus Sericytochromatia bacterium]
MARLREDLDQFPAVGLLGPRQAGKTTLALAVAADRPSLYLDLESPSDLAKLEDAEAFLGRQQDRLVILDEVHRAPALFPLLRGLIDRARRPWRCGGCGRCWPTARAGCSTWRTWPRPAA